MICEILRSLAAEIRLWGYECMEVASDGYIYAEKCKDTVALNVQVDSAAPLVVIKVEDGFLTANYVRRSHGGKKWPLSDPNCFACLKGYLRHLAKQSKVWHKHH